MMTKEEATAICQQMADESGITDVGLAANGVIRDLIQLSHSKSPLVQVEAIEILVALDPEGWDEAWKSIPEELKEKARQVIRDSKGTQR